MSDDKPELDNPPPTVVPVAQPQQVVQLPLQTVVNIEVGIARTQENISALNHRQRNIEQKLESLMPRREVEQVIAGAIAPIKVEQASTAARVTKIENTIAWAARTLIAQFIVLVVSAAGIAFALYQYVGK